MKIKKLSVKRADSLKPRRGPSACGMTSNFQRGAAEGRTSLPSLNADTHTQQTREPTAGSHTTWRRSTEATSSATRLGYELAQKTEEKAPGSVPEGRNTRHATLTLQEKEGRECAGAANFTAASVEGGREEGGRSL